MSSVFATWKRHCLICMFCCTAMYEDVPLLPYPPSCFKTWTADSAGFSQQRHLVAWERYRQLWLLGRCIVLSLRLGLDVIRYPRMLTHHVIYVTFPAIQGWCAWYHFEKILIKLPWVEYCSNCHTCQVVWSNNKSANIDGASCISVPNVLGLQTMKAWVNPDENRSLMIDRSLHRFSFGSLHKSRPVLCSYSVRAGMSTQASSCAHF